MDIEETIKLFDSCWFEKQIFKKQTNTSKLPNPYHEIQENSIETEIKPVVGSISMIHKRSMSDQLSSQTSLSSGCLSPDTVLFGPRLQTIYSSKEISEIEGNEPKQSKETMETEQKQSRITQEVQRKLKNRRARRKTSNTSKSLSDLEFDEVKGFMDLGFVFSEEDKDSRLVEILPGLNRNRDSEEQRGVEETGVSRPYLSEAWEVFDKRMIENKHLMNWRVPNDLGNEIHMKDNLKFWAHAVASAVK